MSIISNLMKIYPTAHLHNWYRGPGLTWRAGTTRWQVNSEGDIVEVIGVGRGEYFSRRLCSTTDEAVDYINEILGERKHIEVDRESL